MTKAEIEDYQRRIEPYIEGADVTMKDIVVHGLVDECVDTANKAIKRMIDEWY